MKPSLLAAMALLSSVPAAADTAPAYRVVVDQKSDVARIVEVRLEHRLDNAELGSIVDTIIDSEPRAYPRTTVHFLLASSRPADPPWASATSLRETQIRVPGLTAEEERGFREEASSDRRDVVGSWLTSTPATPGRLTLHRDLDRNRERLMLDWQMRGGLVRTGELTETPMPSGTRLDHVDPVFDTHYILAADGTLEIHSKGMLLATAEPISRLLPRMSSRQADTGARGTVVQPWPMPEGDFITSALRDNVEVPAPGADQPPALKPAAAKSPRRSPASGNVSAAGNHGIDIAKVFFGQ